MDHPPQLFARKYHAKARSPFTSSAFKMPRIPEEEPECKFLTQTGNRLEGQIRDVVSSSHTTAVRMVALVAQCYLFIRQVDEVVEKWEPTLEDLEFIQRKLGDLHDQLTDTMWSSKSQAADLSEVERGFSMFCREFRQLSCRLACQGEVELDVGVSLAASRSDAKGDTFPDRPVGTATFLSKGDDMLGWLL
ncbi:hypothetical protein L249_2726 [Ophiocordyceps polyrhachis-furcata BCC 54312]|uniref:Uncharacterized protein n=1 Tax=Ophiocordyceps polyrhachis-furcata BCC 54312 TaxID=1330021 RepID=A0A367LR64_9HYPO|nr:hypothetical protein L249_2726 [Ophiocordyceps polyrhachis-furcata BCC 54312]